MSPSLRPTKYDVCFGRGRGFHQRPGNLRFHEILQAFKIRYQQARTSKADIVKQATTHVRQGGAVRFLKQVRSPESALAKIWVEAPQDDVLKKVAHVLRAKTSTSTFMSSSTTVKRPTTPVAVAPAVTPATVVPVTPSPSTVSLSSALSTISKSSVQGAPRPATCTCCTSPPPQVLLPLPAAPSVLQMPTAQVAMPMSVDQEDPAWKAGFAMASAMLQQHLTPAPMPATPAAVADAEDDWAHLLLLQDDDQDGAVPMNFSPAIFHSEVVPPMGF